MELNLDPNAVTTAPAVEKFDMMGDCIAWYNKLVTLLEPFGYKSVTSNSPHSKDRYLVKEGDQNLISWTSKPAKSFRVSNHWNWRANKNKCENPSYIQCYTRDMPWARKRRDDGVGTRPMIGCAVAFFTENKEYKVVYGEKFDRMTKTWSYVTITPEEAIKTWLGIDIVDISNAAEQIDPMTINTKID